MRLSFKSPSRALEQDLLSAAAGEGSRSGPVGSWRKQGVSRTGTCVRLQADRVASSHGGTIAPLILTWRGDEPLDRLHICIKVSNCCFHFGTAH